ncbi:conserved hypothetical protein [Leishmania major strain Friedlin]|uniref:Zinc finger, C3HC4 type (RING finger) family protein n=1 Tax=Leishmania major TaxID=5664 RepID=Q4QBN7_LEIMA|nr:conserved hypothetical protein [Leishmania major strain Friedlin]CAG9573976.1 Zinc_finger_-_C3HC4_type_(RING_finger)_containing_protein_-_putative [Leishmania major strain Friedlin]CAJ04512.1 conserved hypothetical protein [Leishmania major strain Friedlin]|eukprot:XP_001683261.1 conserved hypothetical protein [Leishmania major strain Friedlin]
MEFDALLNTLCLTSFVLFGLWIVAHAVQVVELHFMMQAYTHHKTYIFTIPFVPLITRLFHEMAVPQFLASEAIQRGELPPAMRTHGHRTPAAVPVEYVDADGAPSLSTLTNFDAVSSASLSPPSPSALSTVLNKSPANTPTDSLRRRAGRTKKERKRKRAGDGVDRESAQHQEELRQQGSVAVSILDPNLAAAGDLEFSSSPSPAWWAPQLEGRCLVFGLRLPFELLPASRSAPPASAFANAEARGVGGSNSTGNRPGSGHGATTRQPTVNLQLKQYQLIPASLVASAAAPSPALHHHTVLSSNAELQTQVAVAQQLSVAPVRVYTRAAQSRARINTSVVPSPLQCYSSPAASSPSRCTWPGALPLARTPSPHLDFDSIKYAYTQYYQRLLETAVAEQAAIAHRARKHRKLAKSAQHIATMLMHYLKYARIDDDVEDDVNDGDAEGRAGGGGGSGSAVDTSRAASSKRRTAATPRARAGHGNASVFPSRIKRRRRARSGKNRGGVGMGAADRPQRSCGPWIPVLGDSAWHHSDKYDAVRRDGDLVSSALSSHSLYHTAAPLSPSQLLPTQQSSLNSRSSPSLMQPSQTAVVPPPLPPVYELRRGISKRRRRAETPSIADSAVEALEGLVERVRLAQTLRPRYQSLLCTVRFAAERFIVRRGASEPPTWTPLQTVAAAGVACGGLSSSATDGRGAAKPKTRCSSSSSSLSPYRLHLHRRYGSTSSDSATAVRSPLANSNASASAFGAQGSWTAFGYSDNSVDRRSSGARVPAALSSQISNDFAGGQFPGDTRSFSLLPLRPSPLTAIPAESRIDSRNNSSFHSHRSDSPSPALALPNAIVTAPTNVSAEIAAALAIPPSIAVSSSSGSTSAANAAIQFLRASRLRENNIRAAIAAGAGISAVSPPSLSSILNPSPATSLSSSSFYSAVAAPAATRAPREVGSPHRCAVEADLSMSAEGALPLSRDVATTGNEPVSLPVDNGDASGKEVQRIGAAVAAAGAVHAPMDEVMTQQTPSRAKDTASRLLRQQRHPQPASSSSEEAPQRGAASATSPSLQPRSTDLRIVYVIGADRATLLRSLTLDATRSFAAGTRNFLCFFTRKDERRAQRRYMEQLDRQNRAALQLLMLHETPADAPQPREQRDRGNTAIGHVHVNSAAPLCNRAEETLLSAGVTAALRSVPGPPWNVRATSWTDVNPPSGGSRMCGSGSVDGGFGGAGTVNQQPRATRPSKTAFFNVAGADLLALEATPTDSAPATVTAPSAHQCDDSFLSMTQSLEASFRSVRELSHAAHPGTAEVAAASVAPDNRSSSAPVFAATPSLSMAQPMPTAPAPPAPLAACGDGEAARGAEAEGTLAAHSRSPSLLSHDSEKPSNTVSVFERPLLTFPSLEGTNNDRAGSAHVERRSSVGEVDSGALLPHQGAADTTAPPPLPSYTEVAEPLHLKAIIASNPKAGDQGILDHGATDAAATTNPVADADVLPLCLASNSEESAAAGHKHVDVAPPTVSTAASPIPAASAAPKKDSKESEKHAAAATAKTDSEAAVIDSVSAHDVRQYLATVGVTLPQQVYLLRDAGALTPLQQLQRSLAASSHHASVLTSRKDTSAHSTGTDAPTAAVPPTVGGTAAHHRALLSASAAAVLSRGATRVVEGQVEVAELSLDVLRRQISPFVPLVPPPLSDSDGDDGAGSSMSGSGSDASGARETSESYSRSSGASDDDDGKVVVREDVAGARRSSPFRRRGKPPQKSRTAAAANHHLGHSSKNRGPAQRSGKASRPQRAHSRRRHQQHSRSSRGHGRTSARSSLKRRRRQHERRRKRHLDRWNRHIQHQRAAANKADSIPVAAGVLFFTAPPKLPTALARQQRQLLLEELESGERGRLLVPDWALSGSEVAAPATGANEDARQDVQLAPSSSPHNGRSPPRSICVTLIYAATAEQVAQALVRAAEVAATALKSQSAACDAADGWGHRNREAANLVRSRSPTVAARRRKRTCSGRDSHEFLSSNADNGLCLSRPSQQRPEAAFMGENWHGHRDVSLASTEAPSKNSLCHSFVSEKLMPRLSRAAFSTVAPDAFVGGENLRNNRPVDVPPPSLWRILSPNGCSETATFSEESMEDTDFSGRHGGKGDGSTAAPAAAASPLIRIHDRPPSLLLITESSDSAYDYCEGRSGSGGSATAVGGRWDSLGRDAASDGSGAGTSYDGVGHTGTSVYVEELERSSSSARGSSAHFADSGDADDDVEWASSARVSAASVHAAKPPSKSVRFKATEARRGEEDKVDVAHELMNVLRDSACFPDGVPVGVSLAYVRIGNDLYAITEVVDRTFLQYREERVIQSRKSREEGDSCSAGDGDDDSLTSLSDSAEDAQADSSLSYSSVSNSSVALDTSFKTLDAALKVIQEQHKAAAQQQYRRLHRRRAVSASNFGDLSYSLAGSAPLRPGMRRQEVHMCWRCLSAEAAVIFVPCGHYAVCEACAEVLADCCLCRTPILSSVVLLEHHNSQQAQKPPSEQT